MPRLDTRLEAEAAEFLVLGQLLLNRITAHKTYTRMPGYDLVAMDATHNRSAKIQVKSRWETGASGFLIKSFDSDFVVVVRLNRGRSSGGGVATAPEYFVFPTSIVRDVYRTKSWSKAYFTDIERCDDYRDAWPLIARFLSGVSRSRPRRRTKR
jgi:hypothetical protein